MATKIKRVFFAMKDKVNTVSRLKEGEWRWGGQLAEEYGVGAAKFSDINVSAVSNLFCLKILACESASIFSIK